LRRLRFGVGLRGRLVLVAIAAALAAAPSAFAGGQYVVNTSVDSSNLLATCTVGSAIPCSLRDAIGLANGDGNAVPGSPASITFAMTDGATIDVKSSGSSFGAYSITKPTLVDGSTQTGGFVALVNDATTPVAGFAFDLAGGSASPSAPPATRWGAPPPARGT
jgi:hypothetical protein